MTEASKAGVAPWPPAGVKWYYSDNAVAIACADCREIVPGLGRFGLLLTDPPYGLGDRWTGGGTWQHHAGLYAQAKKWDQEAATAEQIMALAECANVAIVWGGQLLRPSAFAGLAGVGEAATDAHGCRLRACMDKHRLSCKGV
jgi:hypothetical protein